VELLSGSTTPLLLTLPVCFVYSTAKYRNDLWMLEGYHQPGLWN
jgi:hypothetical protein